MFGPLAILLLITVYPLTAFADQSIDPESTTVRLEEPVYFSGLDGTPLIVLPGSYRLNRTIPGCG